MRTTSVIRKRLPAFLLIVIALLAAISILNASWFAPAPNGTPTLYAHRGVHQTYNREGLGRDDCTATRIYAPTNPYLENTIPSMTASFALGADVIELDIHPTTDGQFIVFHDWSLECRTDGRGVTREQTSHYLKSLDIGYGYTYDDGKTYPFRGSGEGMMPTLDEVYTAFPGKQFLLNIKSNQAGEADLLLDYLEAHDLLDDSRLMVYGGVAPMNRLRQLRPDSVVFDKKQMRHCAVTYLLLGWTSYVPKSCRHTVAYIPINLQWTVWGWPNRFLARMRAVDTLVMILGETTSSRGAPGLTEVSQLAALPKGFDGGIWIESIEKIGPAFKH